MKGRPVAVSSMHVVEAALHNGEVAGGQMAVEVQRRRPDVYPLVGREGVRVDAGAGHDEHSQPGHSALARG